MSEEPKGLWGFVLKFGAGAAFGGIVSFLIFYVDTYASLALANSPWGHVYWIVPAVCGLASACWFEEVIDAISRFFECVLHGLR